MRHGSSPPHGRRRGRALVAAAITAAALAAFTAPAFATDGQDNSGSGGSNCQDVDTTVPGSALAAQAAPLPPVPGVTDGPPLAIHGKLCLPDGATPQTVMLALHGITYTSSYWNAEPPVANADKYNFSKAMNKGGYAVFAIDRLGYGDSAHPTPEAVTLDVQAEVAHQLIGQLRDGKIGDTAFPHVALVGHSYGTATSWRETAKYNDADAVIGTGWGNTIQTEPLARFFSGFYPAAADVAPPQGKEAKFRSLPPGYLTPMPGGRDKDFLYRLENSDPAVRDYDATVLRDTVTDGEGVTFYNRYGAFPDAKLGGAELNLPLSDQTKNISVPTFQINGQYELFFCGPNQERCQSSQALTNGESAKYWTDKACFLAGVTPDAGHNLNLQENAPFTYDTVLKFADKALGPDGANKDSYRSSCAAETGQNVPDDTPQFGAK
ncbi:MAG: alpha/beta hydrolase [Actinomycetota bacterium]|nr:alpha/beta hydrolase [Actinomycetota bacterium]